MQHRSVFIVGAGGMVGSAAAQALALKEVVHEIVLIDVAKELVEGQAMDLSHATAWTNGVQVRAGVYSEIKQDDIVVISSGLAQKPGQSRLELLEANAKITRDVVGHVMAAGKEVFILMVANPVDILTQVALETSGLQKERVFGTGTTLDTARLRVHLAHALHVSQQQVSAYILGEHGDSSFPALSAATVGGVPLASFPGYDPSMTRSVAEDIRAAAYKIIEAKKSTYYGIGNVVASIVKAMTSPVGSVFPVCCMTGGEYGLSEQVIGLPSLVSNHGARIISGYPLSDDELHSLQVSADTLHQAWSSLQAR